MNKNTNSRHWFLTWETNKLQKKTSKSFDFDRVFQLQL